MTDILLITKIHSVRICEVMNRSEGKYITRKKKTAMIWVETLTRGRGV